MNRLLVGVGLVAMVLGAIDPLEGSVVILAGAGIAAAGALAGRSRHRRLALSSMLLIAVGVAALFALSAVGGFGGNTGRSNAWWIALVPYPVGWIVGLVAAIRMLREFRRPPAAVA